MFLLSHSKLRYELSKIKKDVNQHGVDFDVKARAFYVTIGGLTMSIKHEEGKNRGFLG